jgi:hypothetical protein
VRHEGLRHSQCAQGIGLDGAANRVGPDGQNILVAFRNNGGVVDQDIQFRDPFGSPSHAGSVSDVELQEGGVLQFGGGGGPLVLSARGQDHLPPAFRELSRRFVTQAAVGSSDENGFHLVSNFYTRP